MTSSYLDDLLAQPTALADTLAGLQQAPPLTCLTSGRFRRIVLTGMGSSYHAAHPFALRLSSAGLWAQVIETSELLYYYPTWLEDDTLIVAISQSGASAEIVHLLDRCRGRVTIVGVTNTPDSPLAQAAAHTVLMRAGTEASVSCKTYLATLVALCWVGDQLLAQYEPPRLPLLQETPQAVAAYMSHWQEHVAQFREVLSGTRQLYLVGRGPSLATLGTGALIVKESAHWPTEGLSSAAFRHGPFEIVSPETFVLGFAGPAATAGLNARLVEDVLAAGGRAGLVTLAAEPDAFHLPPQPEEALPLLEILPVQMTTLALADLQGLEAGRFRLGNKITVVE